MATNPTINVDSIKDLTDEERAMVNLLVAGKGKNQGRLRASAPAPRGDVKYVWRMVAFQLSTNPQHWCMPVCADFDIDSPVRGVEGARYRNERAKVLNKLVDKVVDSVPKEQWHGIRRWRGILG